MAPVIGGGGSAAAVRGFANQAVCAGGGGALLEGVCRGQGSVRGFQVDAFSCRMPRLGGSSRGVARRLSPMLATRAVPRRMSLMVSG